MKKNNKNSKDNETSDVIFAPVSKPQEVFLNSQDIFFCLFGGGAGGGKSACILGSLLPLVQYPGTRAMIIRQTTKQLSGAGSLFDAAINLFQKIDPKLKIRTRDLSLTFSSGAQVQFTYLDTSKDRYNLQGKELSFLAFDECQQLSLDNVLYALSRVRSTIVPYTPRVVATCNPQYDSFLREWVEFCLDERGIPIRPKDHNYPVRYFVQTSSGIKWYDSLVAAQNVHGTGDDAGIKSFKFVPTIATDNTVLVKTNPGYISTLKALPRVEMERLLMGSWYAREQASGFFKRDWVKLVEHYNIRAVKRVRSWDLAFSEPSEARPDVDSTAGVLMSKDKDSIYTVENIVTIKKRVHEVEQLIFRTASEDGCGTTITLPLDPGGSAGAYCRDLAKRLSEQGYNVKLIRPEKGKLQRFLPFASASEAGFVHFVDSYWLSAAFNELETMNFTNKTHDDIADACSDAFYTLNRDLVLPNFSLPTDLVSKPSFGYQQNTLTTNLSSATSDLITVGANLRL